MPRDREDRDINMPDLLRGRADGRAAVRKPGAVVVAAARRRVGSSRGDGRTSVRGGYGLYFNTNNQQNLIVTVTNPPATPRVVIANPTFPVPPFERATGISVRPIQYDVQYPRVHMWNVSVQQEFWSDWVVTVGYAGARGQHLWRNSDLNVPTPTTLPTARCSIAAGLPRPNTRLLGDRAEVERRRLLVPRAHRRRAEALEPRPADAVVLHVVAGGGHDAELDVLLRLDDRTTSAMPEFIPGLQQGPRRTSTPSTTGS